MDGSIELSTNERKMLLDAYRCGTDVWIARRAHIVLLRAGTGRLARHTMRAAARLVSQSLQALHQKPLHPFVDKAPADPDRGSNVGNRHPISDK